MRAYKAGSFSLIHPWIIYGSIKSLHLNIIVPDTFMWSPHCRAFFERCLGYSPGYSPLQIRYQALGAPNLEFPNESWTLLLHLEGLI